MTAQIIDVRGHDDVRIVAERGWQAVTIDLRGHGESDCSSGGDYRLVCFGGDSIRYSEHCRQARC